MPNYYLRPDSAPLNQSYFHTKALADLVSKSCSAQIIIRMKLLNLVHRALNSHNAFSLTEYFTLEAAKTHLIIFHVIEVIKRDTF